MVLLGNVRELEVEPERTQDERLLPCAERRVDLDHVAVVTCGARIAADPLDELEQPLALLLDEHDAENRPELPDVAP
jgi:hypothetical protein